MSVIIKDQLFAYLMKRHFKIMEENLVPYIEEDEKYNEVPLNYIMTLNKKLESLGFCLGLDVIETMKKSTLESFVDTQEVIMIVLEEMIGKEIENAKVIYPNFPLEVMEMEEAEICFNAILHYLTLGEYYPESEEKLRNETDTIQTDLKTITLGSLKDLDNDFINILKSPIATSDVDMEFVTYYINFIPYVDKLIGNDIPNKENKAKITYYIMHYKPELQDCLIPLYKTGTDVLRLAAALSDEDVTLSQKVMFRRFSTREKRLFAKMLNNCKGLEEDMFRNKTLWLRFGERISVNAFPKYKHTIKAFNHLRSNLKPITFYSKVEKAFKENNLEKIVAILNERPSEFARCLNRVILQAGTKENQFYVAKAYGEIVSEVSNNVLWSVISFFRKRNDFDYRVFIPKGQVAKPYIIPNDLDEIDSEVIDYLIKTSQRGLLSRYAKRETLNKVYIEETVKNCTVPTVMRNLNESLETLGRGSKIKINPEADILIPFIYWENEENERVDVDLSVLALKEDFTKAGYCSYYQIKDNKLGLYHSGDIVDGTGGASEYISVHLDKIKSKARYLVLSVNVFSEKPFMNLDKCFCGLMERKSENINQAKIFDPKTVINKTDLATNSTISIPMIIDLEKMEYIWLDYPVTTNESLGLLNNLHYNMDTTISLLKHGIEKEYPTIEEVVKMNVRARMGEITENPDEADLIIGKSEKAHIKPSNLTELSSNWL